MATRGGYGCAGMISDPAYSRAYDKGERRLKHVGTKPHAEIKFDDHKPKKWVGKCPNNIPDAKKLELLNSAIPGPKGDSDADYDEQLYAVHEGVIYEAQTSDGGRSYHAYPYKGKLPKSLVQALKAIAIKDGCFDAFKSWFKEYIDGGKL